jgi:peptide deformylase
MIEIGTLVRLKFKAVRYSKYDLRSEKIERDEDKPVGIVIKHGYKGMNGNLVVKWVKGNAEIGHPTGSIGYFDKYNVEVIA